MNPSRIAREYLEHGRSATCPIIDMHGHVGTIYPAFLPSASLAAMRRSLERCGVRQIVCSHHIALSYDPELGNALMQEIIDTYPDQFLGYWLLNPNSPGTMAKDLRTFDQTRGFVGFKFWPDYHLVPVTSPLYAPVLEYANEHSLLVLVHTWGGSLYDAPHMLAHVAEQYPRVQFLMGHSGYGDWATAVSIARDLPNVYLDLTSTVVGIDYTLTPGGSLMGSTCMSSPQVNGLIEYMVETASARKVVYGSDLPWLSQHYHAGAVLFARISDEARHDILHHNAERLLGHHLERGNSQALSRPAGGHP